MEHMLVTPAGLQSNALYGTSYLEEGICASARMEQENPAEREAIRTLARIATEDQLPGWQRPTSIGLRIEAAKALATFLPDPEALEALMDILKQPWAPVELHTAAAQAIRDNTREVDRF